MLLITSRVNKSGEVMIIRRVINEEETIQEYDNDNNIDDKENYFR